MRTMLAMVALVLGCGAPQPEAATDAILGGDDGGGGGNDGGSGGNDLAWYQSGSRIKMVVLNSPDGAKQFQGWHDVMRNEDCAFVPTSDGVTRCLPTPGPLSATIYEYALFLFADAACTVPVVRVPAACSPLPTYIVSANLNGCQTSFAYTAVHQLGQMFTSAYQKSGANCSSIAPDPSVVYYARGAAVPLTAFQTATRALE
jgi:hypothetical protein